MSSSSSSHLPPKQQTRLSEGLWPDTQTHTEARTGTHGQARTHKHEDTHWRARTDSRAISDGRARTHTDLGDMRTWGRG